jgi:hypothetical protein
LSALNLSLSFKKNITGKIEDYCVSDDTLRIIYSNEYPVDTFIAGRKDTLLKRVYSIVLYYKNTLANILPIEPSSMPSNYHLMQNNFYFFKNKYYFTVRSTNSLTSNGFFLTEYNLFKGKLIFKRFLPYTLSTIHRKYNLGYNFLRSIQDKNYFINQITNEINGLDIDTTIKLNINYDISDFTGIKQFNVKINFGIYDIKHSANEIHLLTKEYDEIKYLKYSLNDDKISYQKVLYTKPTSSDNFMPKFINDNMYITYNSESGCFVIRSLE